jgi:Holliday junction resolvase RusA-like endonuclease
MSDFLYSAFVPGNPVPKSEIRVSKSGRTWYPPRLEAWKETLATHIKNARSQYRNLPIDEAVELYLWFQFEAPRNERKAIEDHKSLFMVKSTQPDFDNLSKPVCDVSERCGVVVNDSRFCTAQVRKLWTVGEPGVQIHICKPEAIFLKGIEIR